MDADSRRQRRSLLSPTEDGAAAWGFIQIDAAQLRQLVLDAFTNPIEQAGRIGVGQSFQFVELVMVQLFVHRT